MLICVSGEASGVPGAGEIAGGGEAAAGEIAGGGEAAAAADGEARAANDATATARRAARENREHAARGGIRFLYAVRDTVSNRVLRVMIRG